MVLGLLTIAAIPTVIGVGQAVSAQKKQNATAKDSAKFNLTAELSLDRSPPQEVFLVLADGKLYVDHPYCPVQGHRFDGYYFTYPGDEGHKGLVSTISDDPPMLNWIFVDATSRAVRFAGRKDSMGNVIGPWGWSDDELHLVLHGSSDGFIAVRERAQARLEGEGDGDGDGEDAEASGRQSGSGPASTRWAVYWDPDGELRRRKKAREWRAISIRRRMKLGMESRYVKADER